MLHLFSAGSANDYHHRDLWVRGAAMFIPQLNDLLKVTNSYERKDVDINQFKNETSIELGALFKKNGSDKSTKHDYHIFYSHVFKQLGKDSKIDLLEIGIGTNNPKLVSTMGPAGRPGASLYTFQEYLPNASIRGGDIDKDILFESDRISTSYVDQLDMRTFSVFADKKYDVIIDDGLHSIGANFNTLLFGLQHLKKGGWILIEDIVIPDNWRAIDFILQSTKQYTTYLVRTNVAWLYVVHSPAV